MELELIAQTLLFCKPNNGSAAQIESDDALDLEGLRQNEQYVQWEHTVIEFAKRMKLFGIGLRKFYIKCGYEN